MADGEQVASSTSIGVRELRSALSAAIRRAAQGDRIVVTVDGVPTAQLGPLEPAGRDIHLADLAAAGLVDAPQRFDRPEASSPLAGAADANLDPLIDRLRGR